MCYLFEIVVRRRIMTTKEELIQELKDYATHHQSRLRVVDNAVRGLVPLEEACVKLFDCPIHKWMERRDSLLNKLYGTENVKALYARHDEWHETSDKICQILDLKNQRSGGLLGKVFGKKQEMREGELDRAKLYVAELKEITEQIDGTFERMIKRANAIQKDMFEETE